MKFSKIGKKRSSENTHETHNLKTAVSQAALATKSPYGLKIVLSPQRFKGVL